ncbi:MAG: ATP-binding protein [Pseudomonadota bacterium]
MPIRVPSIAQRLLLMGGSLLILMTATVGFVQWQLEAARDELSVQEQEIARGGGVLTHQTMVLREQQGFLDAQLASIDSQFELVERQSDMLRGQQQLIADQADAVGVQWVIVDLAIQFHALRFALASSALNRSADGLPGEQSADAVFERLQLLNMMEVLSDERTEELETGVAKCIKAFQTLATTPYSSAALESCNSGLAEQLESLLETAYNGVVQTGTRAHVLSKQAVNYGTELEQMVAAAQKAGADAGRNSARVEATTDMMSQAGRRMYQLTQQVTERHDSIRSMTAWLLLGVGVAGAMLIAIFYRAIIGPIRAQSRSMLALAGGDGDIPARMTEHGPAELGEFAKSFNRMRKALTATAYSKNYVDNILASLGEGLSVCTPDGRAEYVNATLATMLKVPADHMVNLSLTDFVDADAGATFLEAARRGETLLGAELALEFGGVKTSVLASVTPLTDSDGAHAGSVCLFLDISARKKVEEHNRVLASFPAQNPGPVMRIDGEGAVVYANPGSDALLEEWQIEIGQKPPEWLLEAVAKALDTGDVAAVPTQVRSRTYVLRISPQVEDGHANIFGFDDSARMRHDALRTMRLECLDRVSDGTTVQTALRELLERVDELFDGATGALMLHDDIVPDAALTAPETLPECLHPALIGSAQSLMAQFAVADDGAPLIVCDLAGDEHWATYADALNTSNYRAAWSVPVFDPRRSVIGVITLLFEYGSEPEQWGYRLLGNIAETISMLVERLRSENALAVSEERYRSLVEGSIQGIYVHRDLRPLFANQTFADMVGLPDPEAVLKLPSIMSLFSRHEQDRLNDFASARIRGEEVPSFYEVELVRPDGQTVIVENQVRLVNWQGETAVQATAIDITERKHAERELLDASQKALAAAESKAAFLATMSHELRTPLNGVLGMLQLLEDTELSVEQLELVSVATESGESLLGLINDVLDFSRLDTGRMELEHMPVELTATIDHVRELLLPEAQKKSLLLEVNHGAGVPESIVSDPLRLKQVITNLVSNAVKFTERGSVTIDTAMVGSTIKLSVRDTGIGIASGEQRNIFNSFTQADNSMSRRFGGSGLGLSISRQLVELMGGRIELESSPGLGSTFTVSLPQYEAQWDRGPEREATARLRFPHRPDNVPVLANTASPVSGPPVAADPWTTAAARLNQAPAPGRADGAPTSAPGILGAKSARGEFPIRAPLHESANRRTDVGGRSDTHSNAADDDTQPRRLLIVDDNEINRLVTCSMVGRLGYVSEQACDGAEALQRLASNRYALVLMDCQMPVMDGFDATRAIRASGADWCDLPVVALTANAMGGDRKLCLDAGMNDYLAKPVRLEELQSKLEHWLQREAGATEGTGAPFCDRERVAAMVAQLGDAFTEVLTLYGEDAFVRIESIAEALRTGDAATAAREARALRSASTNIGALQVAELAGALAAAPRTAIYPDATVRLDRALKRATRQLQHIAAGGGDLRQAVA